jgi:UDP-N-acetylglucosamine--N-acetylmuramyl-(pentapeptide) pyrophosphoryl-undecaprenol N-acetylglucosamine transferase
MNPTLLIVAGGTGGHIMPGLAIADLMHARGWTIRWLGTSHGMDNSLVPKAGWTLDTIAFAGLRGKGLGHMLRGCIGLIRGIWKCFALVGAIRPQAVLGMGGYVTVPGGLSAALRGAPLVLMNSDATLLLSNRLLLPFARRILFGLPGEASRIGARAIWTGCPVRAEIAALEPPALRFADREGPLRILVVGGSLGAAALNRVVPEALALLPESDRPIVVHQSGSAHLAALAARYQGLGVVAEVLAFIENMAERYAAADVVICRAGAITVSELTAAGVASVLVPLTVSTTTHQRDNALYLERAGAAVYLAQESLTADRLAGLIGGLNRSRLAQMAGQARALGKPMATATVADVLENVAKKDRSA